VSATHADVLSTLAGLDLLTGSSTMSPLQRRVVRRAACLVRDLTEPHKDSCPLSHWAEEDCTCKAPKLAKGFTWAGPGQPTQEDLAELAANPQAPMEEGYTGHWRYAKGMDREVDRG